MMTKLVKNFSKKAGFMAVYPEKYGIFYPDYL